MPADSAPPPDRLLRCTTCGRLLACSADEATEFTRIGWPVCCGEVMTYSCPAETPNPQTAAASVSSTRAVSGSGFTPP